MTSTQLTSRRRMAAASSVALLRHSSSLIAGILARGAAHRIAGGGHMTEYLLWRHELEDGETTTVYAVRHVMRDTRVRVRFFARPRRLDVWCRSAGVEEAVVGGFFVRDPYRPLGEVWIDGRAGAPRAGRPRSTRRAAAAWSATVTACGSSARDRAPERPRGRPAAGGPAARRRRRGRSSTRAPTTRASAPAPSSSTRTSRRNAIRAPRSGCPTDALVAVACDGRRSGVDAGLSMLELAGVMVAARAHATRSTSTAAGRRRSSIAATCSTGRTRPRTSRRPSRGGS